MNTRKPEILKYHWTNKIVMIKTQDRLCGYKWSAEISAQVQSLDVYNKMVAIHFWA